MKNILKIELKRAFTGSCFIIALLIGVAISISHFIMDVLTYSRTEDLSKPMGIVSGLLAAWMGGNSYNFQGYLFFLILPILAVMPYVYSYHQDKKYGMIKNMITRTNPVHYYTSKWIAVFLSAGTVIVLPLILNILLFTTVLPSHKPQIAAGIFSVGNKSLFAEIFINDPLLYIILFFIIIFIYSGLIANIGLIVEFFTDYLFVVLLFPFLLYIFSSAVLEMFILEAFAPNYFLKPSFGSGNILIIIFEGILLFLITFIPFVVHGRKRKDY